jgi:hypothetical protein
VQFEEREAMTTEQLHAMHTARPFMPFVVVMADGSRYKVPHPEHLAYVAGKRTCAVYDEQGVARVLDLLLMTALEPVMSGKRRRAS